MIETVWAELFGVPFASLIPVGAAWVVAADGYLRVAAAPVPEMLRAYAVVR